MKKKSGASWSWPPAYLLPAALTGIWGCLLLRLAASGDLLLLQNPRFHALTWIGGGLLVVLALSAPLLFGSFRPGRPVRMRLRLAGQAGVALLPVAAYWIQPPGFDTPTVLLDRAWAASSHAGGLARPNLGRVDPAVLLKRLEARDPAEPVDLSVIELFIIEPSPELRTRFAQLPVRLLAQFLPDEAEGRYRLIRLFMVCCAADARPIGLMAEGVPPEVEPGEWIQVTGRLVFEDPEERVLLRVEQWIPAEPPADVFLY